MSAARIVEQLLRLIAEIAPGVIAYATSSVSDEEAIAEMVERVEELPIRGGPTGTDAADIERLKRGG